MVVQLTPIAFEHLEDGGRIRIIGGERLELRIEILAKCLDKRHELQLQQERDDADLATEANAGIIFVQADEDICAYRMKHSVDCTVLT